MIPKRKSSGAQSRGGRVLAVSRGSKALSQAPYREDAFTSRLS